nr:CARDB domain-containing protein [Trichodesmium sp. MO_231.B1]
MANFNIFSSLVDYQSQLGGVPTNTQDFEGFSPGFNLDGVDFLPGIFVTSNLPRVEAFKGSGDTELFILDRQSVEEDSFYNINFDQPYNAVGFDIDSFNPSTPGPAILEIFFTDGDSESIEIFPTNATESDPIFFGVIADTEIDNIILTEGPEINGVGNEEIALDNFIVPQQIGQPDLQVTISIPDSTTPGTELSPIEVTVKNNGDATAFGTDSAGSEGYMVDLILSSDTEVPDGFAIFSPNYNEDVLLQGGRISNTPDLAPGEEWVITDSGGIPADTPVGDYYLAAQVDPGKKITESDETNNVAFEPIQIEAFGSNDSPDLIVTSFNIAGEAFISRDNLKLPIEVVVQNQGNAPADLFKVDVQYMEEGNSPFVVAFTADETSDVNPDNLIYPFTKNPLEVGEEVTFTGELTFIDNSLIGQPISLVATADSTAGDEFIPESGRVEES